MTSSRAFARTRASLALVALALALVPTPLSAQYFGRNKVQYERFDFRITQTDHFDVHWYPAESLAAGDASRMSERWYTRLSNALTHAFTKKPIIFYANHPDFQQTNVVGGFIDQSTGGITEGLRTRIIMPFTGVYAENDHVLGHEIVHGFQYDMALRSTGGLAQLGNLPLWGIEGMAEYLSVGRDDPHTAMWLRDAVLRNDLPTIRQLTRDSRYFPYRYGQALWAYVGGQYGDEAVGRIFRVALREGFEAAFKRVLNRTADSVSKEWHALLREAYGPVTAQRTAPDQIGTRVLEPSGTSRRGETDISPSLSPDGQYLAFFSGRGIFGIDLYIANAQTGDIVKRLTSPNNDNHFDALSFLNSAGSWSPDGKRLVFVTQVEGDHELTIYDVEQGRIVERFQTPLAEAIVDPAWGPDGRIAFIGYGTGISDLFVWTPGTKEVQQLTNDRNAELHPAWSPDGRTIAFTTDRDPATDFERLEYAPMRLALMEVATRDIRLVPRIAEGAKHINPQWSPDGQSLFFIADRGGVSDVYRWSLDGTVTQVTRLATGVSGITTYSPALTVARQTGRMMFSVFTRQGNTIIRLEPEQTLGTPLVEADAMIAAGILPPATQSTIVANYLDAPLPGLPAGSEFDVERYRSKLQLDYIGTPGVGLATSPFGTGLAGAIALYFGDMLGNRVVGGAIAAQGTFKDIGGEVFYLNQERRWNWLVSASHIPYLSGFATARIENINGVPFEVVERQLQRAFYDQIGGTIQYPFSQTRRAELSVAGNHVSYDVEIERYIFDCCRQVAQERVSGAAPPSVTYGQASAALVGDYSIFGLTSPVAGGRWRLEVSPIFGELNFQNLQADWRRYFYLRPVTLAFRALHFGRYGKDAESNRISPLFVGYEQLLRGYSFESFDGSECSTGTTQEDCPEFDRLIGSKIGVASLELRIPLLGPEGFGVIPFNFLPLEIAPFVDAAAAWTKGDGVKFTYDRNTIERVPVFSYGVSTRVNLLGYAVFEAYFAYPTHRQKGWHWGFNFAPGW